MVEAKEGDEEAQRGVDEVIGPELAGGYGELGVDGLGEEEIQFSGSDEFGEVG